MSRFWRIDFVPQGRARVPQDRERCTSCTFHQLQKDIRWPGSMTRRARITGHRIATGYRVTVRARLGGLHHDYDLEPLAT